MINLKDTSLESREVARVCSQYFGVNVDIKHMVIADVSTGKSSFTSVFEASDHTIYALCTSNENLTLADVRKIIHGMGMEADAYLPPMGSRNYFEDYGRRAFAMAYPARKIGSEKELAYYKTMAPYSPALVRISKINGEIREYLAALQRWQKAMGYSYRRIKIK
ncbi:MAG: hypothetical protein PVI21_03620 [Candidatus Woesebacteria bacterium]|jgi:hypothetical protein